MLVLIFGSSSSRRPPGRILALATLANRSWSTGASSFIARRTSTTAGSTS